MKTKEFNRDFQVAGILAAFLTASILTFTIACGSTTKVTSETSSSVGQQLLDLEKAHSSGVISDKEYEKLRKSIVKSND